MSGESIIAVLGIVAGFGGVALGALLGRASARESSAASQRQALAEVELALAREQNDAVQALVSLEAPFRYDVGKLQADADQLRTLARKVWVVGRLVDPRNWPESSTGKTLPPSCPTTDDLGWAGLSALGGTHESALTGFLSQLEIYRSHREAYLADSTFQPALATVAVELQNTSRDAYALLDEAANDKESMIDDALSRQMHRKAEMLKFDTRAYERARAALENFYTDRRKPARSSDRTARDEWH